jgi:hypothetical protein
MAASRIRAREWSNGRVTLSDGDVAALARQAADLFEPELTVRVAPAANDDPYRWGAHGWTVTVDAEQPVQVWVPADASPDWVVEEITTRLRTKQNG